MSHYKTYGKPEPRVGGFIVDPKTKTITVYPKDQPPKPYAELKTLDMWDIFGHTLVWYNKSSTGELWYLVRPSPIKGELYIRIEFRGTCYVTGGMSFYPNDDGSVHFFNSGMSEDHFRKRVVFQA